MTDKERAPPRLLESPGSTGELLRRALSEAELAKPLPRFTQLQERRVRRTRRQLGLVLAAAALALVFGVRALRPHEPPVTAKAEPVAPAAAIPISASASAGPQEAPALRPAPSKPSTKREAASKPRAAPMASARVAGAPAEGEPQATDADEKSMPTPAELTGGAKPCAELARSGAAELAIGCYEKLSAVQGVTAELALFEQARLAGKMLRQPARALAVLDTYRARFPNGSLRAEVMLARVEWLLGAGNQAGARVAVDEALASGLLTERSAELKRIRDSLEPAAPDVQPGGMRP